MDNPAQHKEMKKREYRAKGKNTPEEHGTNVPKGWKPTIANPLPPFRCTGTVRSGEREGERCNKWGVPGMAESNAKCTKHGGQIPAVKNAAQNRIAEARQKLLGLTPDAVSVIHDIMISGDNDSTRLKAAQDILDRTGILKGQELQMEVKHTDDTAQQIRDRLMEMKKSMEDKNNIVSIEEEPDDTIDVEPEDDIIE